MNKAEKAELAAWKLKAALAWPTFERPEPVSAAEIDIATGGGSGIFRGWWVISSRGVGSCVGEGVSLRFGHATHPYTDGEIANRYKGANVSLSQGIGGPWFRDREDALKEAAWRMAFAAAETLDGIYDRVTAEGVAK